MFTSQTAQLLHHLVAKLERQVLDQWRNANAPGYSMQDALAMHCKEINTHISRRPGGNSSITVSVVCRQEHRGEQYYFSLQRAGNGLYLVRDAA